MNLCNHRNLLIDKYPKLVESEWDYEKNKHVGINVSTITCGSGIKSWWHCDACKGKYQMTVYHKTSGRGCPYCLGKKILIGFNDLQTKYPELIEKEWDYEKNNLIGLKPDNLTVSSRAKASWHCDTCKGNYQMSISNKTSGRGCPFCSGKKILKGFNDLESCYPDLVNSEWDWIKNNQHGLKPDEITKFSNMKAYWKCDVCNSSYEMSVSKKTGGHHGCPYCSGHRVLIGYNDLASCYPDLVNSEWDWIKNNKNGLKPYDITSGSTMKAWWKCSHNNSHSWYATVSKRVKGQGCPKCSHRISKQEDEVADYINDYLQAMQANYKNMKYTMFRSIKFKKVYEMLHINTDDVLSNSLQSHLLKELDIYIPELGLAVEYDGDYWHDDSVMLARRGMSNIDAHMIKKHLCSQANVDLIFIMEHDWLNNNESMKKNLGEIIDNHINMINH